MSVNYPKRTEPTFFIVILLTMVVASIVLIATRLIYTATVSAPFIVIAASYLLALILLLLSGALLFQKAWSLFPLSLIGKGYLILEIILLLVRADNVTDIAWLSTAISSLYLALLNYINPIRSFVGQEKVSGIFLAGRVASTILFFATLSTIYLVLISNLFPEYAYRVQPQDYNDLAPPSDTGEVLDHSWSERWKIAIPGSLKALDKNVGIGIWTNPQKEKVIVTPGVWSQQVEKNPFLGFTGPYRFEKAVWNAGIGQPFLLVLKMVMADEGTEAYQFESSSVKSMIILSHSETLSHPVWYVSATVYPADDYPYTIESASTSLERALLPVNMTIRKLQEGS